MKVNVSHCVDDHKEEQELIKKIADHVLNGLNKKCDNKIIEIKKITEYEIQKINYEHRGILKPTDVLSFAYSETGEDTNRIWGEIFISHSIVARNANQQNIPYNEEFTRVVIHGLLHLFGYDHENVSKEEQKIMNDKQEGYLKELLDKND